MSLSADSRYRAEKLMEDECRFGYVTYDTTESASSAIENMDGIYYEGRQVFAQYARVNTGDYKLRKPKNPPSRTIFVSRIPAEMTVQELHELFDDIHNVIDIRVSVDRRTGYLRGFAHAEFLDLQSAKEAFEVLGKKRPHNKPLKLDYSHTNRKMPGPNIGSGFAGYEPPVYSGPSSSESS